MDKASGREGQGFPCNSRFGDGKILVPQRGVSWRGVQAQAVSGFAGCRAEREGP